MNPRSPGAFLLSAALHSAVIAIALLVSYASNRTADEAVKVFELVAGPGGDYMATEAPAEGVEGGIKVAVAQQPVVQPTPPQPAPEVKAAPPPVVQTAPPVQPTPKTVTPKKTTPPLTEDQRLKQTIADSKRNATRQIAREQKAEEKKRLEQEKKEKERLSKEQFDRDNKNKTKQVASAAKNLPVKKIDVDGITGGVAGGSSASKKGAGGTALKNDNTDELAAYTNYFLQELRRKFEPPPGLGDELEVKIEVTNNPDGSLTRARVSKSSGNKEFDDAVLDAIRRVKLGPRPDKTGVTFTFAFAMRERGQG
jgi:TonB family protein